MMARITIAGVVLGGLAACGDGVSNSFFVRDSIGITIAENRGQAGLGEDFWAVSPEPLVRIGTVEGRAEYQLHDVQGVVRLEDNTLVVANAGSCEIRFYDGSGQYIRTVGREGDAPGEYRLMTALGAGPGDSLWVYDYGLRRFTVLTRDGDYVRLIGLGATLSAPRAIGRFADGSFAVKEEWSSGLYGAWQPGLTRGSIAVTRLAADGHRSDTVATVLGREVFLSDENGRAVMSTPLFGRTSSAAVCGNGFYIGSQETYEILRYSANGELRQIVRVSDVDLSITQAAIDAVIQRELDRAPESRRATLRSRLESMEIPPGRPAYGRLHVDMEGNLWAAEHTRYPHPAHNWMVFDPAGRRLGIVRMPRGFRLQQVGADWVAGVLRDEMDVEHVTLHRLSK